MSLNLPSKIDIIRHFARKAVAKVNELNAIGPIRDKYSIGDESRSLAMEILGVGKLFFVLGQKQVLFPDDLPKPTAMVALTEDTFIKMKDKKITFDEAYWYGLMDIGGDFWIRDLVVFREIFREYGDTVTAI